MHDGHLLKRTTTLSRSHSFAHTIVNSLIVDTRNRATKSYSFFSVSLRNCQDAVRHKQKNGVSAENVATNFANGTQNVAKTHGGTNNTRQSPGGL